MGLLDKVNESSEEVERPKAKPVAKAVPVEEAKPVAKAKPVQKAKPKKAKKYQKHVLKDSPQNLN